LQTWQANAIWLVVKMAETTAASQEHRKLALMAIYLQGE
jgi:hypothetical protein